MEQDVHIPTTDGLLDCVLVNEGARKAVLFAPGFGQDSRHPRFKPLADALAAKGFAVLQMNYRHVAAKHGADELTLAQMAEDFKAALAFVKERYAKVGVVAKSISTIVYFLNAVPVPAVLWGPVIYPESNANGYIRDFVNVKIKDLFSTHGFLKKEELAVRAPMLIVHGSADEISPLSNAEFLASHGAELHVIEGADHGYKTPSSMEEALRVTVEFLEKNV